MFAGKQNRCARQIRGSAKKGIRGHGNTAYEGNVFKKKAPESQSYYQNKHFGKGCQLILSPFFPIWVTDRDDCEMSNLQVHI